MFFNWHQWSIYGSLIFSLQYFVFKSNKIYKKMLCFISWKEFLPSPYSFRFYRTDFSFCWGQEKLSKKTHTMRNPLHPFTFWLMNVNAVSLEICKCELLNPSFWIPPVSQISQIADRSVTINRLLDVSSSSGDRAPTDPVKKWCIKTDLVTLQFCRWFIHRKLISYCFTLSQLSEEKIDSLEALTGRYLIPLYLI